jgi:hypothetical protein
MNKLLSHWEKQLDQFDVALDALADIEPTVRVWGALAPALPALYDALAKEIASYHETSARLRAMVRARAEGAESERELGVRIRDTIEASRRVKSLIDAYNREKEVAGELYPEMASGSLKDTPLAAMHAGDEHDRKAPRAAENGSVERAQPRLQKTADQSVKAPNDQASGGQGARTEIGREGARP